MRLEQQRALTGFDATAGPGFVILEPGDPYPEPLRPGCKARIIVCAAGDEREEVVV
jgi:hypothetical protein